MTCSVPLCTKPVRARGWCTGHYQRWRLYGDVNEAVALGPPRWTLNDDNLPNPWAASAPPCPLCGEPAYLWGEGPLCWFCAPCKRRFDVAQDVAA